MLVGPTSAAIVVSSSKGAILPTTMAQLAVDNGYRTANNGTAWAYYSFVADYFDFEEYSTTSSFSKAMKYLETDKDKDGVSDYFIIASCGSGLFTTGGHYIVLIGNEDNTIEVYDPYLYSGKFNTASRRKANVKVSGNSVYVSESSFKTYANYKNFWVFSNDEGKGNTATTSSKNTSSNKSYTRYVSTESKNLNVRKSASINSKIVGSLKKGTKVTVTGTKGNWSKIGTNRWVSTSYLSSKKQSTTSKTSTNYKVKITTKAGLNIRSGAGTSYKKLGAYAYNKTVTITQTSGKWGKTNKGWICLDYTSKVSTSSSIKNTVGKYKRLKSKTTLYSKSNLSGTKYTYLPLTQVKIIKNVSSKVDYVYVVKTGRYAYVRNNVYK